MLYDIIYLSVCLSVLVYQINKSYSEQCGCTDGYCHEGAALF